MAQIQLRRGTVAAWAAANPILADGEPGFALPDGPLKVGNGIDPWLSLPVSEGGLTKAEADNTYVPIAEGVTATLSGNPSDPDINLFLNGVEL